MAGAKRVQMARVEDQGRQTNNGQITNGLMGDQKDSRFDSKWDEKLLK